MLQFRYRAKLEDGTEFEVTADQRDVAAFECEPFGCAYFDYKSRPYTYARYLAWHAAKRASLTKLAWDTFTDQCVEVRAVELEPDPEAADPGQSAASADI